jgi:AcrR family transcriptional regulator
VAAGLLVEQRGQTFGLPDLARRANVSMATVYRHFADVNQVLEEYQARLIKDLTTALQAVPRDGDARSRLHAMGQVWVGKVDEWGPSAVRMRSHRGLLERVNEQDSPMKALYGTLEPVIREMIADGYLPRQPINFAVLMWVTIFDERVILESRRVLGWGKRRTASQLTAAVVAILQSPHSSSRAS